MDTPWQKGQAGRAYGAAFTASVCGGLFGAVALALAIPIIRPFIMAIGTQSYLHLPTGAHACGIFKSSEPI